MQTKEDNFIHLHSEEGKEEGKEEEKKCDHEC